MSRTAVFYEAWSGTTGYLVGDVVTSGGSAYLCVSAHTNHVPPNGTYWLALGGGAPSGSAGGVLDGTYPNPGLAAGVAGAGLAETSDVLSVNVDGSTLEISADALRVKDLGITTAKLADAGPGATGPIGDATHTPAVTIDAKGRVTGLSSVAITAGIPQGGPLTTDLAAGSHKITGLTDPGSAQDAATKAYVDAAAGGVGASVLLYDYTVAGSDKASIDTGVDTPDAGSAGTSAFSGAYRVLEIWIYARTDESSAFSNFNMTVNNDGSSIYDKSQISVVNTTVAGALTLAQASWSMSAPGASDASGVFGLSQLTIPNYAGTVGNKFAIGTNSVLDTTAANVATIARTYGYRSTSAITRVAVVPVTALKKFKVGSRLLIYAR